MMQEKNDVYHVLRFADQDQTIAFVAAFSRFLAGPRGNDAMNQPLKLEVWVAPTAAPVEAYLNATALDAFVIGFGPAPIADVIAMQELPDARTLVLGDSLTQPWGIDDVRERLGL